MIHVVDSDRLECFKLLGGHSLDNEAFIMAKEKETPTFSSTLPTLEHLFVVQFGVKTLLNIFHSKIRVLKQLSE
jgi:hypothetical protein